MMNLIKLLLLLPLVIAMLGMVMGSDNPLWLLLPSIFFLIMCSKLYPFTRKRPVYLVDFAVSRQPEELRVPFATYAEHVAALFQDDPKLADFCAQVLSKSSMGEETCMPAAHHYIPPRPTKLAAEEEFRQVIFTAVDEVFASTGISPDEIDVVAVNCSAFSTIPSLASVLVNHYKMREDVKTYNLSGMGCSAEMISLDAARAALQSRPDTTALIASTEIITPYSYLGKSRSMQVTNCIFRMGGAAMIVSNRRKHRAQSKYRLLHLVRTQTGADDRAYQSVHQKEDAAGLAGFDLARDLPATAGEALLANITALAPLVLPATEKLRYIANYVRRRFADKGAKPYVPNFRLAFDHFCIHAGGPAIIDSVQKSLRLSPVDTEASRMTLYRFGNTSSSSPWYSLAYTEAKGRVKKGDMVWQIALGSGFKCNSAVWECLRQVRPAAGSAWSDCIDKFPVDVSVKPVV